MSRRKQAARWSESPAGVAAYQIARAEAQAKCNADGFDRGIEANDLFGHWHTFMLPQRRNRTGHELQCEVISCETLDRCQPGHGPRSA